MSVRLKAVRLLISLVVPLLAAGAMSGGAVLAAGHATLFASPDGSDSNPCTASASCRTISHTVSVANPGDTVRVQRGTYHEDVTIATNLDLRGDGNPIIDANGLANGVLIQGAAAAGTSVRGFTVQHATFEGILVRQTHDALIRDNVVTQNDQGTSLPANQQTGECAAAGLIPGDCGEGLHLWSVTNSQVLHNTVVNNAGGILLTDENGPTSGNVIDHNTADNNLEDCGITIAGHNAGAFAHGVPQPNVGGVYTNTISHNEVNGNGIKGEGAGILLAGGPPGTAVYNNRIVDNVAQGNGLAGVTLHSHAPGQDLDGNVITGNRLSNDNLDPDHDFSPFDPNPTGIYIASQPVKPVAGTVIQDNDISDVYYGIWTLNVTTTIPVSANHFAKDVKVPVLQQ